MANFGFAYFKDEKLGGSGGALDANVLPLEYPD